MSETRYLAGRVRRVTVARMALLLFATLSLPLALHASTQQIPFAPEQPGKIVYTRAFTGDGFWIDMFIADANGENETHLIRTDDQKVYGSTKGEDAPRWSADGRHIAFASAGRSGLNSVWRVPYTGGTPTPIAKDDGEGGDPAWHPNEDCIAYSGAHAGAGTSTLDLKVWCAEGGVTTVLDSADRDERGPDWSPDGDKIAFVSRQPPKDFRDQPPWSLHVMNADGTGDELVLEVANMSLRVPRWSPDGTRIAFISGLAEGIGAQAIGVLHVIDMATREVTPLVTLAAAAHSWSPDGTKIVFYNTGENPPQAQSATSLVLSGESPVGPASDHAPVQVAQHMGLYMIDLTDRSLSRLHGRAGGSEERPQSFTWGYSPDWTGGTPTATPLVTDTPTATATATATNTPTVTNTPEVTYTPSATATATATATVDPSTLTFIYLPVAFRPSDS